MKNTTLLLTLAAALCAVGARAQGKAPSADAGQSQTKEQRKAAWENGVKTDCAAEIAPNGVCAGLDFGTGLDKCLHKNRKKLSDGCKAAVRPHRKGGKSGAKTGGAEQAPAPAAAPAQQ